MLAAGLGERLKPVTNHIPKCLVPVNGIALMDYWIEQLLGAGIERLLVNTHYLSEQVVAHVSSSKHADKIDIVHEKTLLNTGGTILENKAYFNNEAFMVVHADNLSICNYSEFIESHKKRISDVEITMMTFKTDVPENCGVVELNQFGVVTDFLEKVSCPPTNLANGAVYIMEPSVIHAMESLGKKTVDISLDIIPRYLGRIGTYFNNDYHRDIGTVESYALSQVEINLREEVLRQCIKN